ncbi:MAG: hypothetical protein ABIH20_04295 [Candidatus Diapherotrites archaeon]
MDEMDEPQPKNNQIKKIVIGLVALVVIGFLLVNFNIISLGNAPQKTKMLVIGSSSEETLAVLNESKTIDYTVRTPQSLDRNPGEILAEYEIVMLDQSKEASKEVTKALGDAVVAFVKKGGSFILVKDSGTRRPDSFDVIGWKNTFEDIIPVECDRIVNDQPTCVNRLLIQGKLLRKDESHPILQGIDIFPADPSYTATFEIFDIGLTGKEIAFIERGTDGKEFIGIAEKNLVIGKSIYFNYNPGKTKGIFESTLDYLG